MKNLIVMAISLFSISAVACPNLEGDYVCQEEGQSLQMSIYQDFNNDGAEVYSISTNGGEYGDVITDRRFRRAPWAEVGEFKKAITRAYCRGKHLYIELSAKVRGTRAKISGFFDMRRQGRKKMIRDFHAAYIVDGVEYPFNMRTTCRRR